MRMWYAIQCCCCTAADWTPLPTQFNSNVTLFPSKDEIDVNAYFFLYYDCQIRPLLLNFYAVPIDSLTHSLTPFRVLACYSLWLDPNPAPNPFPQRRLLHTTSKALLTDNWLLAVIWWWLLSKSISHKTQTGNQRCVVFVQQASIVRHTYISVQTNEIRTRQNATVIVPLRQSICRTRSLTYRLARCPDRVISSELLNPLSISPVIFVVLIFVCVPMVFLEHTWSSQGAARPNHPFLLTSSSPACGPPLQRNAGWSVGWLALTRAARAIFLKTNRIHFVCFFPLCVALFATRFHHSVPTGRSRDRTLPPFASLHCSAVIHCFFTQARRTPLLQTNSIKTIKMGLGLQWTRDCSSGYGSRA